MLLDNKSFLIGSIVDNEVNSSILLIISAYSIIWTACVEPGIKPLSFPIIDIPLKISFISIKPDISVYFKKNLLNSTIFIRKIRNFRK